MLGDGTIGRKKPLGVARGLESLHTALPLACRLVGILCAIIEIPMLAMFYPWENLAHGGSVALEFVRDDDARDVGQSFQEFAKELLCRSLVTPPLHQDIEHVPILIDCPPQIMVLAFDRQKHFIEVLLVSRLRAAATELISILLAKLATPLADRLIGHDHATFEQ